MRQRRRNTQSGFTLIELMITVAIIGILASIAIPTYQTFVGKGKKTEANLALDMMMKNLRVYHLRFNDMPPSSVTVMPTTAACGGPNNKTTPNIQSVWQADPGFGALEFHVDEPGYYQYQWERVDALHGTATATADFDCDSTPAITVYSAEILEGNVTEILVSEVSDD